MSITNLVTKMILIGLDSGQFYIICLTMKASMFSAFMSYTYSNEPTIWFSTQTLTEFNKKCVYVTISDPQWTSESLSLLDIWIELLV